MADKIIQNPSITTNDFEYDGAGRVSAISGHPLAGEGGGEGATYSAGPNIDITNNIISGKDWTSELSAKLDSTAFTLPTSANWDNTYSTVNSESANWTKVYDTVTANSANWNNDLDTLYSAGPNINITDNTISGRDWTTEINAKLDTTAFTLPTSATWDDTYNTVNSNSAQWSNDTTYTAGQNIDISNGVISGKDWSNEIDAKLDTTAFSLPNSGNWDNTYNTVNANSAQWSNDTTYSAGPNIDITNNLISGKDWTDTITAASAYAASLAQSGSNFVMIDDATTSYSAIGLYEQYYDPGCYQIMGTANNGSAPGKSFGYTLPTQSRLFSADCVDSAKNYTNSAISAHIMYVNYEALVSGDVTFANIRTCINNGGIVIPYEINLQSNNYKIYNYELSGVNNDTTGYTFGRFEASGKHQYMVISSYYNGATTGCITANEKLYATPNDVALVDRIVIVATSGDIPSSGKSDNKVYIVSGTK